MSDEEPSCILCGKEDEESNLAEIEVIGIPVASMHLACAQDAENWARVTKKFLIDRILSPMTRQRP